MSGWISLPDMDFGMPAPSKAATRFTALQQNAMDLQGQCLLNSHNCSCARSAHKVYLPVESLTLP